MQVHKLGEGEPEYAIIGSLHGDEPCGKESIERFLNSDYGLNKSVKFIIANEKALDRNVRFVDVDLNRNFPGDIESELHEEKLAAKIMEEVQGLKVLDIHSTRSYPEPFATMSAMNQTTKNLCRSAGVENAVYFPESNGTLNGQVDGILVEAGHQGTDQAIENAYTTIINFLAAEGVIDEEFEISDPTFFEYYEKVEGDWVFEAENFQEIREGKVFAKKGDKKLEAEENFYPVLMSTDGYDGMLGFKAKKLNPSKI